MTFLSYDILWHLAWLLPLFMLAVLYGNRKRRKIAEAMFKKEENAEKYTDASKSKRRVKHCLYTASALACIIAAAQLAWGRDFLPDTGPGRDLLVIFDVSRSMLADDVKPTRLAQGQWLVRQLAEKNPADRFGLIAFAGTSFLQCPLTTDKTSFLQLTDGLDTDTIPMGGTNIQHALETAVQAFESAEGKHKAVILITDGDELTGQAENVTKQLADANIPLFIAGMGDPANPSVIHVTDEKGNRKILTDEKGNAVKSPLNEKELSALAQKTAGIYVRSTAADPGLNELQNAIDRLDRKTGSSELAVTRPIERPFWTLGTALFLLILAFCIPERRTAVIVLLCLFTVLPLAGQEAEQFFNAGVQAQKENDNAKAKEFYEKAVAVEENAQVRANAYQNMGVIPHKEARAKMSEANEGLKNQNPDLAQKALEEAIAKLDEAETSYRESFRYGTTAAANQQVLLKDRKNAEELKKEIEELKKRQQQAKDQTKQAKDEKDPQKQQQKTRQAEHAADQMKQQAEKLEQQQMAQSADNAKRELQKAQQEQQRGNQKKADEHLDNAMKALGAEEQKQEENKSQDKEQSGGKKDGGKKPEKSEGEQQQNEQQTPQQKGEQQQSGSPEGEPREIDKEQAEAILDVMARDEKDFRDMLKEIQKRNAPQRKVEKDW